MLPLEQGGVVDPTLKVYGTNNVYVADAGIIPLVSLPNLQLEFRVTYRLHSLGACNTYCGDSVRKRIDGT